MGDFVKIAVKTSLVAIVCVAIYQIFATITIPSVTTNFIITVIGRAKSIMFFYMPWIETHFSFIMVLCQVAIGIWGFYFAMLAVRWILKVNE